MEDPYAVLGVSVEASRDEIRKAYRALAREWHPDRRPDDPEAAERFKEVATAWEVLGDDDQRRAFDAKAGRARSGILDEEALDAVSAAIERAQDWAERGVLPQIAARWRGEGSEAVGWALRELPALSRPGALPAVGWLAGRHARALAKGIVVSLSPWPLGGTQLVRRMKGWEVLVDPAHLWGAGFRGTDLDDAVQLRLAHVQSLCVGRFVPPATPDGWDDALKRAADRDGVKAFGQRLRWGGWLAVLLVLGLMFTAGYNGW